MSIWLPLAGDYRRPTTKTKPLEQIKVETRIIVAKRHVEVHAVSHPRSRPGTGGKRRDGATNDDRGCNRRVRIHGKGNFRAKPRDEVIAEILAAIRERRA